MTKSKVVGIVALMLLCFAGVIQAEKFNIGVVIDGPIEQAGWTPAMFMDELKTLTRGEAEVHFPPAKQLDGAWSAAKIKAAFTQLQDDPEVDMVLALGYVSSAVAALSKTLRKPTFAPIVIDAQLLGLPRDGNASGVENLNYLTGEADFVRDLASFRNVAPFANLAVFVDKTSYDALPGLIERAKRVASQAGVELRFIVQSSPDEDLAAKLPADVDAVIVTSLPRMSRQGTRQLIDALIAKRLPSCSLLGSHLVEQGLLMSESPDSDWKRLARRTALNMHDVIAGESAAEQPVLFKSKRQLTINMATARAIALSPRFDVLSEAVLLNEEAAPEGPALSLSKAAREALRVNLDLRANALGLQVGQTDIDQARAKVLPQVNAGVNHLRLNSDGSAVSSGIAAEASTVAVVGLEQLIYSDQIFAEVEIQRYLQHNREAVNRQLELDIIQEATTAYLDVLKAQTFVVIRKENLRLTRANLDLAQERRRVGVANPAEVYRWQSELATVRQQLLAAQAQRRQARDALNRLLHRPLKQRFKTEPATLDDPSLLISRKALFDYVNSPHTFELLGDFLVQEGLAASPELEGLHALIAANERQLKADKRAYWAPTVTLQGELSNVLEERRLAGLGVEGDTDWKLGANVSLPLFEGGARQARLAGSRFALRQRRLEWDAVGERIEQRIRVYLHQIRASFPSIQLSNDAELAARKNLNLVTDAYSRGKVFILDLLDAQNAALLAEEAAANAVFDFLTDLMNLQRAVGQFDFFLDDRRRDEWFERLKRHIDKAAGEPG